LDGGKNLLARKEKENYTFSGNRDSGKRYERRQSNSKGLGGGKGRLSGEGEGGWIVKVSEKKRIPLSRIGKPVSDK